MPPLASHKDSGRAARDLGLGHRSATMDCIGRVALQHGLALVCRRKKQKEGGMHAAAVLHCHAELCFRSSDAAFLM